MDRLPGSTIHVYRDDVFRDVCRCAGPASANNSEAAKACHHGGYADWTDADGNAFRDAGACVSYVARGETVAPVGPAPYVTVANQSNTQTDRCGFAVTTYRFLTGNYYFLEAMGGKAEFSGTNLFYNSPWTPVSGSWWMDGNAHTVTVSISNAVRSELLATESLELQR